MANLLDQLAAMTVVVADTGDIEFFTTTLNCGADDLAVDKDALAGAWSTTIAAGDDPQDTTCTFGNVRDRTQLRLRKTWVDSAATDAYGLEIVGTRAISELG